MCVKFAFPQKYTHLIRSAFIVHAMQSMFFITLVRRDSLSLICCTIDEDYAIANKLTPFISVQNHHNLVYREEEREMFPTLKVGLV